MAEEAILAAAPMPAKGGLRDLVTGDSAAMEENLAAKRAPKVRQRRKAPPRVSYDDGLKKTSFKDLLAQTAKDPEEEDPTEAAGAFGAAKEQGRARPGPGGGSLLERLSSIGPDGEARPADSVAAAAIETRKAKGWRLPFGSKRK